jgi:hypothetical protein
MNPAKIVVGKNQAECRFVVLPLLGMRIRQSCEAPNSHSPSQVRLEAPVEETDERRRQVRTTRNKDEGRGTPQGGVASPLLANLYMRRFILGWKVLGHADRTQTERAREFCPIFGQRGKSSRTG